MLAVERMRCDADRKSGLASPGKKAKIGKQAEEHCCLEARCASYTLKHCRRIYSAYSIRCTNDIKVVINAEIELQPLKGLMKLWCIIRNFPLF